MADVYHALGLHMHQPLGNLVALHNSDESWEARQILWCYDRPTRMLEGYEDVARLHMSFSGHAPQADSKTRACGRLSATW